MCCFLYYLKQCVADCAFCLCCRYVALHRIQQVLLHKSKWMNVRIVKGLCNNPLAITYNNPLTKALDDLKEGLNSGSSNGKQTVLFVAKNRELCCFVAQW